MSSDLALGELQRAVSGSAVALRAEARLRPVGGDSEKVFPPTYARDDGKQGGQYATERRRVGDREVETVLLDSVQSQANRMEEALLAAWDAGRLRFPLVSVDFSESIPRVGRITALDAPHRVADAILRDSLDGKVPFRDTPRGSSFVNSGVRNATPLFEICPTALLFGMWDSTGPRGGLGAKFARLIVSEIVGFDAVPGKRTSSRIDPFGIGSGVGIYEDKSGAWTPDEGHARLDGKGQPVKYGKEGKAGKPSSINHGNVTPTISDTGGFTISHARQSAVLSLAGLRRLQFPDAKGRRSPDRDAAARTVLAALGVAAMAHVREAGFDLRSRCLLRADDAPQIEVLSADASAESPSFALDATAADRLFSDAVAAAAKAGVTWHADAIVLRPAEKLIELIKRSEALEAASSAPV